MHFAYSDSTSIQVSTGLFSWQSWVSIKTEGGTLFNCKGFFIAHNLSLSSFRWPDLTEILLKGA